MTTARPAVWRFAVALCLAYIAVAAAADAASYSAQRSSLRSQLRDRASSDAAILAAGSVGSMTGAHGLQTLQLFVSSIKSRTQGLSYAAVVSNGIIAGSTTQGDVNRRRHLPLIFKPMAKYLPNGDVEGLAPLAITGMAFGTAEVILSGSSIETELRQGLILETLVLAVGLLPFILISLVAGRAARSALAT